MVTARPWLSNADVPRAMPTPYTSPTSAPIPSPKPTLTPEVHSDVEMANQEPEPTIEIEAPSLDAVEPTPQEPAAKDLLENSWLRRQLQPAIKSPTDSSEPMGLINRIKGVIGRSAGR